MTLADLANVAGALGFILSIYIFVTSRLDKRPRLSVDLFEEVFEDEDAQFGPKQSGAKVFLDVCNPGTRRVKVMKKQIELANGFLFVRWRKHSRDYPSFKSGKSEPFWLPPGDSFTYATDRSDFASWLEGQGGSGNVFTRGLIIDATGNRYRSSWRKFSVRKSEPR